MNNKARRRCMPLAVALENIQRNQPKGVFEPPPSSNPVAAAMLEARRRNGTLHMSTIQATRWSQLVTMCSNGLFREDVMVGTTCIAKVLIGTNVCVSRKEFLVLSGLSEQEFSEITCNRKFREEAKGVVFWTGDLKSRDTKSEDDIDAEFMFTLPSVVSDYVGVPEHGKYVCLYYLYLLNKWYCQLNTTFAHLIDDIPLSKTIVPEKDEEFDDSWF